MSLSVAGVWAVNVWDQTVWADGVWREGEYVPTVAVQSILSLASIPSTNGVSLFSPALPTNISVESEITQTTSLISLLT